MLVLTNYDNSNGNAAKIYGDVTVYDTSQQDVTAYLKSIGVIDDGTTIHGWIEYLSNALAYEIVNTTNALAFEITNSLITMSEAQNAGETPIFFARIINSETRAPLTQTDISTITYTIYRYAQNSIRNSGNSKEAVENWEDISLTVSDVILNDPVSTDPRTTFSYNFMFEPDTLSDNPFETASRYSVEFIITPTAGNRIPLIFTLNLN